MDLIDRLRALGSRAEEIREKLQTEEATKMALVVPFIEILGYATWNPEEVVPEFIADVPMKKGEKVDYALKRDGVLLMLIECKKVGVPLDGPMAQLRRYFNVSDARVGVVTNGINYRFYSDLEKANVMDNTPFLEFDIRSVEEETAAAIKRFTKVSFDVDRLVHAAEEMKYTRALIMHVTEQFTNPDEEIVRFFTKKVFDGLFTQGVREKFEILVKRALRDFIDDRISHRLSAAQNLEEVGAPPRLAVAEGELPEGVVAMDGGVVTTQEEVDAFLIVKAIVSEVLPPDRIHMRDGKAYCSVLVDNNNRRRVCRFWFNAKSKNYISLFDAEMNENKVSLSDLDGIYAFKDELRAAATMWL